MQLSGQSSIETDLAAIIDIGSNSVRLVVYENSDHYPFPVYSEKVLCALGRTLASTGSIDDQAMNAALQALTRFRAVLAHMGVNWIFPIATAAAREASNGPEFLERAEIALQHPVQLLSGRDEAYYSAAGVIHAIPDAEGLIGDLGGGSFELEEISNNKPLNGHTLKLGVLRLMDESQGNLDLARDIVERRLGEIENLDRFAGSTLYMVGGSWRNFARFHMNQIDYPLTILQYYQISRKQALGAAKLIESLSETELDNLKYISRKRRQALPYGAMILAALLKVTKVSHAVVSSFGVREGILLAKASHPAQPEPARPELARPENGSLIAGAYAYARWRARSAEYGQQVADWMDGLYGKNGLAEASREHLLRHAACLMADISWRAHPDYRGLHCFNAIAMAPLGGLDHPGRIEIALAAYYCHFGSAHDTATEPFRQLIEPDDEFRAMTIGLALRLAYVLAPSVTGILSQINLSIDKTNIYLKIPAHLSELKGEIVSKRLTRLGRHLGREPVLKTT